MKFKPVVIEKLEEVLNAYFAGRCDVYTTDVSGLIAARASRAANAGRSCDFTRSYLQRTLWPGGAPWRRPLVRHRPVDPVRDDRSRRAGITSKNIDQQAQNANPVIQRFLGTKGDFGKMLKLDNRWAFNIIKQVGNYGESFDRNLTPLGLDRGINKLWNKGGLMYAPPLR